MGSSFGSCRAQLRGAGTDVGVWVPGDAACSPHKPWGQVRVWAPGFPPSRPCRPRAQGPVRVWAPDFPPCRPRRPRAQGLVRVWAPGFLHTCSRGLPSPQAGLLGAQGRAAAPGFSAALTYWTLHASVHSLAPAFVPFQPSKRPSLVRLLPSLLAASVGSQGSPDPRVHAAHSSPEKTDEGLPAA